MSDETTKKNDPTNDEPIKVDELSAKEITERDAQSVKGGVTMTDVPTLRRGKPE